MNDYAFTSTSIMDVVIKLAGLGVLEMSYADGQTLITAARGSAYMIIETDKPYLLLRRNLPLTPQQYEAMEAYAASGESVPVFQGGDIIP
ncbi:hypothetical protein [Serratia marcescens]|uniref:hypothetical protein n=1 Tax=Serratia marcescens TaxID=615 RepID=UPI0037D68145